jgi:hypothetical protein
MQSGACVNGTVCGGEIPFAPFAFISWHARAPPICCCVTCAVAIAGVASTSIFDSAVVAHPPGLAFALLDECLDTSERDGDFGLLACATVGAGAAVRIFWTLRDLLTRIAPVATITVTLQDSGTACAMVGAGVASRVLWALATLTTSLAAV